MLVLTRRLGQKVMIGEDVVIEVVAIGNDTVRIGIAAPQDVPVHRQEVYEAIKKSNALAFSSAKNISAEAVSDLARNIRARYPE